MSQSPRFFIRPLGSAEGREESVCERPCSYWLQRYIHPIEAFSFLFRVLNGRGAFTAAAPDVFFTAFSDECTRAKTQKKHVKKNRKLRQCLSFVYCLNMQKSL